MDPSLAAMKEIAQPLDEWCEFCTMKLATAKTADGVAACDGCQREVLEALAKYEAEALEAARPKKGTLSAAQAKARAKRRAKRKRTKR